MFNSTPVLFPRPVPFAIFVGFLFVCCEILNFMFACSNHLFRDASVKLHLHAEVVIACHVETAGQFRGLHAC